MIQCGWEELPGVLRPYARNARVVRSCPCCGGKMWFRGSRRTRRNMTCRNCGKHVTVDRHPEGTILPPQEVSEMAKYFLVGESARRVAKKFRRDSKCVTRLFRKLREIAGAQTCPCGRDSTHAGSCSHRRTVPVWQMRISV